MGRSAVVLSRMSYRVVGSCMRKPTTAGIVGSLGVLIKMGRKEDGRRKLKKVATSLSWSIGQMLKKNQTNPASLKISATEESCEPSSATPRPHQHGDLISPACLPHFKSKDPLPPKKLSWVWACIGQPRPSL